MSRFILIKRGILLSLSILVLVLSRDVRSEETTYSFNLLASLGDPAPGGAKYKFDFEPWDINDRGEVGLGADLDLNGEAVFHLNPEGSSFLLGRFNDPASGGGLFGQGFLGKTPINEKGDMAFAFQIQGDDKLQGGVYRFIRAVNQVIDVLRPGQRVPRGGDFLGPGYNPGINEGGYLVFTGFIKGDFDRSVPPYRDGLGTGIFLQDGETLEIANILRPGDPAPGGKAFDLFLHPSINDAGDIGFGAHVAGEECIRTGGIYTLCGESVYLRKADGEILSLAHQGERDPYGEVYRLAFGAVVNNRREVVFIGDLTEKTDVPDDIDYGKVLGIYLYTEGNVMRLVRAGDPMPGGGNFVTITFSAAAAYDINHLGEVCFEATLDSGVDFPDQGIFVWSKGSIRPVVRTGMRIPGVGTLLTLIPPDMMPSYPKDYNAPFIGGCMNDRGQIAFMATVRDDEGKLRGVLLLANPEPAPFRRGDADGDGVLNITDPISTLSYQFLGTFQPSCLDACDDDDNGAIDINDPIYSLSYQYLGGLPPPAPGPEVCGKDTTVDVIAGGELGCESSPRCP